MYKKHKVILIDPERKTVSLEEASAYLLPAEFRKLASFVSGDVIVGIPTPLDEFFTIEGFVNPSVFYGKTLIVGNANPGELTNMILQKDVVLNVATVANLVNFGKNS